MWPNSGFTLLTRDANDHLVVTDDFLRAYLMRPEVAPVDESCDAERALHARLFEDPRGAVAEADIAAMADADTRDNYRVVLDFRDRLVAAGTVEACYAGLFGGAGVSVPPLFVDQMAQVIVQGVLDDAADPMRWRAGELWFREQTLTLHEGAVLLGDSETVAMLAETGGMGNLGRLVVEGGVKPREVELDVLLAETADAYWARNERHDTVLDLTFARLGVDAFCRLVEAWVRHFTRAAVSVQPVQTISDDKWVWHLGLDAEASAILNDLYQGKALDDARRERILGLFRLEFEDRAAMRADVAGRPVYMALAMTPEKRLRMKPQNLLVNLPLAARQ